MTEMDSDTPRTDMAAAWMQDTEEGEHREVVSADFARRLERENAELRARIAELEAEVRLEQTRDWYDTRKGT